jgi:hypothetical protein
MSGERVEALARTARTQSGVFARRQALAAGFTPHQIEGRIASREWIVELPGVYRSATVPTTPSSRRWAAHLWAPGSLLSHQTAAALWALDAVPPSPSVHLLVPADCRKRAVGVHTHRTNARLQRERRHIDGLPLTSPELTLLHLGASLDAEALEAAFQCARRRRLVTTSSLEACVQRVAVKGPRRRGSNSHHDPRRRRGVAL